MTLKLKSVKTVLAAAAVGVGLAACGSSSKAGGVVLAPGAGPTATTITPAFTAATPTTGKLSKEPTITALTGPAPTTLVKKDLIVGTGKAAVTGEQVAVNYVGALTNGKVFDASWKDTPGKAFVFTLGAGTVITGWEQGVVGMKVGGRRELIIPPSLAYGDKVAGSIPKNSTLIFIIDLLKVGPAASS
jgi:peptidylprolyl isomerase